MIVHPKKQPVNGLMPKMPKYKCQFCDKLFVFNGNSLINHQFKNFNITRCDRNHVKENKLDSELKFDQNNIEINRKWSSSIKNVKIHQ